MMHVDRYESVNAFLKETEECNAIASYKECGGYDWDLGVKGPEALAKGRDGDLSVVSQATTAIDKLTVNALANRPKAAFRPAMAGGYVNVPRYLGGAPDHMMARKKVGRESQHVSIYVCICSSAGVDAGSLLTRGVTILALLESLVARQVGVDLYLVEETGSADYKAYRDGCLQVIRVESQPLDLSTAAFAIAHPAFTRNVVYAMSHLKYGCMGNWPPGYDHSVNVNEKSAYAQLRRKSLGCSETDLIIPSVYLSDPIIKTPDIWLAKTLDNILGVS